ncbi:MAG: carboxylate--amine ligase [Eubacteriales bacterium]
MKNKAVVLGANYYIGLSIIRCLGIHKISVTAIDYKEEGAYAFKSKYVTEKLIAPHYNKNPEDLLRFLIQYARDQELKPVLFPSADPYVEFMDKYLNELKECYLIPNIEQGLYTKAMNKETLIELAKKVDTPVPETVSPTEENYIDKVESIINFPCLVKPVDSASFVNKFRRKLFKVHNLEQLKKAVKRADKEGLEVVVQKIISGFDDHMYTFDAYANEKSKVTHWVTCQKLRQYPINYGASVYTIQKYVPEIVDLGKQFLEKIKWKGFAEIEFKKDKRTKKFYLIEVNVRTTNLNVLLFRSGINMPYVAYQELTGNEETSKVIVEDKKIAFWYAFEDLLAIKDYFKTKQLSFVNVVCSYFKRKAYAIWDIRDPLPYFAFFRSKVLKPLRQKLLRNQ